MDDQQVTVNGLAKGLQLLIQAVREVNDSSRRQLVWQDNLTERLEAGIEALAQEIASVREEVNNLKALYQINMRVLNLLSDKPIGQVEDEQERIPSFS